MRAISWTVARRAGWEIGVKAFCKHETSKYEREEDKDCSDYAEEDALEVQSDEGDRAQMCNHGHKDEIADDVIVVSRDAAAQIEPSCYHHRKAGDHLLVAEGEYYSF